MTLFTCRSLSTLVYGHEGEHNSLQMRCVLEGAKNICLYLNPSFLCKGMNKSARFTNLSERYIPKDPEGTYKQEIMNICKLGCCVGLWQFHQCSSVLQQSLYSCFPEHMAEFIKKDFTQKFYPIQDNKSVIPDLIIMWTPMTFGKGKAVNHFVLLIKLL